MHYMLFYELAPDYLERRPQFRGAHLALAWAAVERGELVLGGVLDALDSPPKQASLLFKADSADVPAAFAKADPYVTSGIVKSWRVRRWNTVVGHEASNPVRSA